MASLLGRGLAEIPACTVTQKVEANEVFAIIPREHIAALQNEFFFHGWNEKTSEARFVTSFDTTEEDVHEFLSAARRILGA
jgi:threonine aldolase